MATGELRERVRERLVATEEGLSRTLAGVPLGDLDPVVALLVDAPRDEVIARRARLARAVANFDAATIATTHGFCQEVLAELGTLGDLELDVEFVEDIDELLDEVVDDLYVRRFHSHPGAPFGRHEAVRIARIAIDNPGAPIEPERAPANTDPAMRRRLALAVRDELESRKRALGMMTYDDLLTRLCETLAGPSGPAAEERLRARYRVVLIDEFQDTDPIQWEIVRRAFAAAGVTLVLIADPKQAIYAFRGADVYAYLAAVEIADERATLAVNFRSDQRLIDAYDALFADARLGHAGIVYRRVSAAPAHLTSRLLDAPAPAPLRIRLLDRAQPSIAVTPRGYAAKPAAREHVARDLAADLVRLFSSKAQLEHRARDGSVLSREPVCPGDVAVLVQTHRSATIVHRALAAVGVPAVINGGGSVFATASARDWLALLEALERPSSSWRARAAALTPFLGWSAARIASAGEPAWEDVHQRLHRWARVLRRGGVAALARTVSVSEDMPARLLAFSDGERRLTDLRHVGQLLHQAATAERLGATALAGWLRERIAAAEQESSNEDRTRRLESDAEAVQVLTIHRSKGLEFPIVYCPFLWEPGPAPRHGEPVFFHDPAAADQRTIDVGLAGSEFARHRRQHVLEERGEELRLAYVALTRARHQAVIWWAGSFDSQHSPLGRLLFARREDGEVPSDGGSTPSDAAALTRLQELAAAAPGSIAVEPSTLELPAAWAPALAVPRELSAARFERPIDARWRRTSYTDIAARAYEPLVGSEPEPGAPVVADEPAPADVRQQPVGPELRADDPLPLAEMPVGVEVGTLVHRVFETTDFAAADLDRELAARIAAAGARRQVELGDPLAVRAGLRAAIETPLGGLLGGARLRDFTRANRLDELEFELPLVGGERPTGQLTVAAIAATLRRCLPAGDPLAGYAERLEDPALRPVLAGYLAGTIDLVVRVRDGTGSPRFAIIDYKTNWLGPPDGPLTAWHYRPASLAAEMQHAHYGLQALLYTVALHRYLRWRLPDYAPQDHLAGVLYLFVRGMTGAEARGGVFSWRPEPVLVQSLSDTLDTGEPG